MKKSFLFITILILVFLTNSCDLVNSDPTKSDLKSISGNFDSWNLGSDKVLRYGVEDQNGNFMPIGSTPISSNGAFKFDSLLVPPDYSFEGVGEGPFKDGCTGTVIVSNKNAQVTAAKFVVTEQNPNKIIGKVYNATGEVKDDAAVDIGGFYTEYVYSKDTLTMSGERLCVDADGSTSKNQIDAKLKIGWNKIIFKTIESTQNSKTILLSTRLSSGGRWFFKDDRPILQSEYDINIDAKFEYWYEGSGKQLQLGEYNYETNQFFPYAYADISAEGKFTIAKTKSPEVNFLHSPENIYADKMNCSINMNASDPKAVVATSRMIIIDKASQKLISEVFCGIDINRNGSSDAGDSELQFVFADRPVTVKGESTCNFTNQDGQPGTDNTKIDLALQSGWNKVMFQFIEFTSNTTKRNLINASANQGNWYYQPSQPDISGSFPLQLSGKFDFWQEGVNKVLVVGETDYQTQVLTRFASAGISQDGQFAITTAIAPASNFLRQAQYLYVDPNTCSANLSISDNNARVAMAHFFIIDKNNGQQVGVASFGYDAAKNARFDPGDYQINLIFSDRDVTITGESNCNQKDPNGNPFTDGRKYNLTLKKGWNIVTEKILEVGASSWKVELTTGMPSQGNWYYGK